MPTEQCYTYELLVIDKNGQSSITSSNSLIHGFLFSEILWKTPETIEKGDSKRIIDKDQKIELKFQAVDTSSTLNDLIESAFLVKITGTDFSSIEAFRYKFVLHLRKKLNFTNIRVLRDDISTEISNRIYPLINKVENILRRYLVKFFILKIGVDWWDVTAPKSLNEKISFRKNNEKVFNTILDTDVTLIDFDDLGELIYKQTSGFNKQENIISKIMNTSTIDDLEVLKQELQGNYTKYFKEAFQDNQFEKKWKELFEIRNKVAHNNLFVIQDLEIAEQLCTSLDKIINEAEAKIDEFKFSIEEQVAIRQATIEAVKEAHAQSEPKEKTLENLGIKVVGKIDLGDIEEDDDFSSPFKIITEEQLLHELEQAENSLRRNNLTYVGLKAFVTKILGNKGYSFGTTYSLVNILKEQGIVEIYDVDDANSYFQTKAIRKKRN